MTRSHISSDDVVWQEWYDGLTHESDDPTGTILARKCGFAFRAPLVTANVHYLHVVIVYRSTRTRDIACD